jgi:HlyD family secretion protein
MDIARPDIARKRKRRRVLVAGITVAALALITIALSQLKSAVPSVQKTSVWIDTVKRGPLVFEVRGSGTLVPEEVRWAVSRSVGRIERIALLPGVAVTSNSIVVELSNPELEQEAVEAESASQVAQADLEKLKVQLESDRLAEEAVVAGLKADLTDANLEAETDEALLKDGLAPTLTAKRARSKADDLEARYKLEQKRLDLSARSTDAQVLAQNAEISKLQKQYELKKRQVEALVVRAGIDGTLQRLGDVQPLQVGQEVIAGANIALISNPAKLKAEIKIPQMEAKDVQIGQSAVIDTRNGLVAGHVSRVDPGVRDETVTVDVTLDEPLAKGARPDLDVDGTITLDRIQDVLFVGRPVTGRAEGKLELFKLLASGSQAVRVPVRFGKSSVNAIEIKDGLQPGDRVILSDMSQWDVYDRIQLN